MLSGALGRLFPPLLLPVDGAPVFVLRHRHTALHTDANPHFRLVVPPHQLFQETHLHLDNETVPVTRVHFITTIGESDRFNDY